MKESESTPLERREYIEGYFADFLEHSDAEHTFLDAIKIYPACEIALGWFYDTEPKIFGYWQMTREEIMRATDKWTPELIPRFKKPALHEDVFLICFHDKDLTGLSLVSISSALELTLGLPASL